MVARRDANALAVYRRDGSALERLPDVLAGENQQGGRIAVGDLNGDGRLDLVVYAESPMRYVRLMGDGAGGFAAPQTILTFEDLQTSILCAEPLLVDLDGDGDLDLIASGKLVPNATEKGPIASLLNDGTGAFGPPRTLVQAGSGARVGEVTGDDHPDVVIRGVKFIPGSFGRPSSDPYAAHVLAGDGTGGTTGGATVGDVGSFLVDIAQLDGVGPEDIVISSSAEFGGSLAPGMYAVPSLGGGTFGPPVALPLFTNGSFAFADLNGDGAIDLVSNGSQADTVAIRLSQGAASGALDFGEVPAGTPVERPLEVRNDGAAPLPLGAASIAGPAADDFALVEEGCADKVLLAGQSCMVRVRFRPDDGGLRTAQLQFAGSPEPRRYTVSGVGLRVPGPAAGAPRCRPVPAAPQQSGEGGAVKLSAAQLRVNQRIGQAAIRRLNAVEAWLAAGIQARDLCGGAIGAAKLASGIAAAGGLADLTEPSLPDPRPVVVAPAGEQGGQVRMTAAQLRINQRIYQAAIRRAAALEARMDGRLTGGELAAGALGQDKLHPRLRILSASPAAFEPAPSRTRITSAGRGGGDEVDMSAAQLRINQRIAQAAVRRANALVARLEAGLTGDAFADGSITARNLASGVVKP